MSYESYASQVSPRSKLNQELDSMHKGVEKHLTKIADDMINLPELAAELGLKRNKLSDIEQQYRRPADQRYELLRVWKRSNGLGATYDVLLKAFTKTANTDSAKVLVELLGNDGGGTRVGGDGGTGSTGTTSATAASPVTRYFDKEYPTSSQLSFVKTKNGKFRLYDVIAGSYKKIAGTLGIEDYKVTSIERENHDDVSRVQKVFQEWFNNANQLPRKEYYPLSWDGLKEILEDSELSVVATQFFDILKDC